MSEREREKEKKKKKKKKKGREREKKKERERPSPRSAHQSSHAQGRRLRIYARMLPTDPPPPT